MRVAILGPWPATTGSLGGGVDALTAVLARRLASEPGVSVHVATFGRPTRKYQDGEVVVHQVGEQRTLRNLTFSALDRRRLVRWLCRVRPDVVHAQGLPDYGLAATQAPFPSIVSVHGIPADEAPHVSGLKNRFRWWTLSLRSARCLARARHLAVATQYGRDRIQDGTRAHIHTLENPVDAAFFAVGRPGFPDEESRLEEPHAVQALDLLCVSRLVPLKRVEDVIAAFSRLAPVHPTAVLRIVGGEGEPGYGARLRARAHADGVADRVHFLGFVPDDVFLREIRRAALVLHASAQENAPVALEQALAAGVPVVAARVGGVGSVVRDGETGFLAPPGDPEALAERARALLGDRDRYRAFSAAARADARRRFHPDAVAARALEIYGRVRDDAPGRIARGAS